MQSHIYVETFFNIIHVTFIMISSWVFIPFNIMLKVSYLENSYFHISETTNCNPNFKIIRNNLMKIYANGNKGCFNLNKDLLKTVNLAIQPFIACMIACTFRMLIQVWFLFLYTSFLFSMQSSLQVKVHLFQTR